MLQKSWGGCYFKNISVTCPRANPESSLDAEICNGGSQGATLSQHLQKLYDAFCPLKMSGNMVYNPNGAYHHRSILNARSIT